MGHTVALLALLDMCASSFSYLPSLNQLINPRHACPARVTVVGSVCVCVCVCACLLLNISLLECLFVPQTIGLTYFVSLSVRRHSGVLQVAIGTNYASE